MAKSTQPQGVEPVTGPSSQSTHGSETTFVDAEKPADGSKSHVSGRGADGNETDESEDIEEGEMGEESEMERRMSAVQSLARQYTQHSTVDTHGNARTLFASEDPNSPLNPRGGKFDARVWAKSISHLTTEHGTGYRTAGVCFQNMNVFGYGAETDYQKDVGNIWLELPNLVSKLGPSQRGTRRIDILRDFDGVIEAGEMCIVLGPPGSGCSTFLKTLAGEMSGIYTDPATYLNYQGLSANEMHKHHKGDAIYTAEVDVHFPMLSVGDTLTFASRARCPSSLPPGISRNEYCDHLRDVVMAMYGISHTVDTRVGNEYIRGVSGKSLPYDLELGSRKTFPLTLDRWRAETCHHCGSNFVERALPMLGQLHPRTGLCQRRRVLQDPATSVRDVRPDMCCLDLPSSAECLRSFR